VKSITPVCFLAYPPAQPKRPGPLITIRTSTFVELLGHAREWDAKFPALAGASRAYLLESFAFADSFCSYAAILIFVLFFAFVPVRGEAQTINAYITGQEYLPDWPGTIWYAVFNNSDSTIDVVSVSGINASATSTNWPYGWWPLNMGNEIVWVCYLDPPCGVGPGEALGGFIVAGPSSDFAEASYLVCGNCSIEDDSGGVAWGTTLGHAQ
jgi:hypothetical protein